MKRKSLFVVFALALCLVLLLSGCGNPFKKAPDKNLPTVNLKDLEDMVKSINASEVAPKDRLSDTVLHYDYKERLLEKASDYETRVNSEIADGAEAPKAKSKKEKAYER